jgi:hypothetical protein
VARQTEGDKAVVLREPSLQLMAENATAGRIAMDQEHWYAALAALLDRQGAVRCDDGVLPSQNVHAKNPDLKARIGRIGLFVQTAAFSFQLLLAGSLSSTQARCGRPISIRGASQESRN